MHEQLPSTTEHRCSRPPRGAEELLDASAVAAWLGVTTAWIYAETRAERIPHIPVGRPSCSKRSRQFLTVAGDTPTDAAIPVFG